MAEAEIQICHKNPNFAVICSFLTRFGKDLGFKDISFVDLQRVLESRESVDQSLIDLQVKLLRRVLHSCKPDKWEAGLIKFCYRYSESNVWEIENRGYKKVSIDTRINILKDLLEAQFDTHPKFKEKVNEKTPPDLRCLPIGRDIYGLAYWYLQDEDCNVRIYREEQDDADGSSWTLICQERCSLPDLIDNLILEQTKPRLFGESRSATPSTRSATPSDNEAKPKLEIKQEIGGVNISPEVKLETPDCATRSGSDLEGKDPIKTEQTLPLNIKEEPPDEGPSKGSEIETSSSQNGAGDNAKTDNSGIPERAKVVTGSGDADSIENTCLEKDNNSEKFNDIKKDVEKASDCETQKIITESVESRSKESKSDMDTEISVESEKNDIKTKSESDTKDDAKTITKVKDDTKPSDKKSDTEVKGDTETKSDEKTDTEVKADTETKSDEKTVTEVKGDTETQSDEKTDTEVKGDTETQSDEKTDTKVKGDTETKTDEKTDTEVKGDTETKSEEKSDTEIKGQTERKSDEKTDTKVIGDTETKTDIEMKSDTDTNKEEKNEADVDSEVKSDTGIEKNELKENGLPQIDAHNELPPSKSEPDEDGKSSSEPHVEDPEEKDILESDNRDKEQELDKDEIVEKQDNETTEKFTENIETTQDDIDDDTDNIGELSEVEDNKENVDKKDDSDAVEGMDDDAPVQAKTSKKTSKKKRGRSKAGTKKKSTQNDENLNDVKIALKKGRKQKKVEIPPETDFVPRRSQRERKKTNFLVIEESPKKKFKIQEEEFEEPVSDKENKKSRKKKKKDDSDFEYAGKKSKKNKGKEEKHEKKKKSKKKVVGDNEWAPSSRKGRLMSASTTEESEDIAEPESSEEDNPWDKTADSDDLMKEESGSEYEPVGRNLKRALSRSQKKESSEEEDDFVCSKCDKADHPDQILLCDKCDAGYHTSCLRPPLFIIPDGDWFCPPCQHKMLVLELQEALKKVNALYKAREREIKRKERLAFVGISLNNILPANDEKEKVVTKKKRKKPKYYESDLSDDYNYKSFKSKATSSESQSESSSSSSSESDRFGSLPRQTRQRKTINYKFTEYDELIDGAIKDEVVEYNKYERPPGQSRGKDMSNIIGFEEKSEKEESDDGKPEPVGKVAARRRKKGRKLTQLDSDGDDDDDTDEYKATDDSVSDASEDAVATDDFDSDEFASFSRRKNKRKVSRRTSRNSRRSRRDDYLYGYKDDFVVGSDYDSEEEGRHRRSTRASTRRSARNQAKKAKKKRVKYREPSESDLSGSETEQDSTNSDNSGPVKPKKKSRKSRDESDWSDASDSSRDRSRRKSRKKSHKVQTESESDSENDRKLMKKKHKYEDDSDFEDHLSEVDERYARKMRKRKLKKKKKKKYYSDSDSSSKHRSKKKKVESETEESDSNEKNKNKSNVIESDSEKTEVEDNAGDDAPSKEIVDDSKLENPSTSETKTEHMNGHYSNDQEEHDAQTKHEIKNPPKIKHGAFMIEDILKETKIDNNDGDLDTSLPITDDINDLRGSDLSEVEDLIEFVEGGSKSLTIL